MNAAFFSVAERTSGADPTEKEIHLTPAQYEAIPKIGVVQLSGPSEVELKFPSCLMDDEIQGRILLINDGEVDASISKVQTSCGCTSAIPAEKLVRAGEQGALLMSFKPKGIGDTRLEARFTFGDKPILMVAKVTTLPRFQQTVAQLTFDESDRVEVRVEKRSPTRLDRFNVFPPEVKVVDFRDTDEFASATLVRPAGQSPNELIIEPAMKERAFKPMRFGLQYKGEIQVLPRRLIASGESLRLFLRGDVSHLEDVKEFELTLDGKAQTVRCTSKLVGTVLLIEFPNVFEPGEHLAKIKLRTTSFQFSVSAR